MYYENAPTNKITENYFISYYHLTSLKSLLGLLKEGDGHLLRQEGLPSIILSSRSNVDVGFGANHILDVTSEVIYPVRDIGLGQVKIHNSEGKIYIQINFCEEQFTRIKYKVFYCMDKSKVAFFVI